MRRMSNEWPLLGPFRVLKIAMKSLESLVWRFDSTWAILHESRIGWANFFSWITWITNSCDSCKKSLKSAPWIGKARHIVIKETYKRLKNRHSWYVWADLQEIHENINRTKITYMVLCVLLLYNNTYFTYQIQNQNFIAGDS